MTSSRRVGCSRVRRYGCQAAHQEKAENATIADQNGTTRNANAAGYTTAMATSAAGNAQAGRAGRAGDAGLAGVAGPGWSPWPGCPPGPGCPPKPVAGWAAGPGVPRSSAGPEPFQASSRRGTQPGRCGASGGGWSLGWMTGFRRTGAIAAA